MKKDFVKVRSILSLAVLAALGAGALMGINQPAWAEKPVRPNQQMRHNRMEKMGQELGLTAGQKTRLKAIMMQTRQQSKAVRENKSLSETQKRQKMRAIHQASRQRMSAVLTTAQRKKMMTMRREHRAGKDRQMNHKK